MSEDRCVFRGREEKGRFWSEARDRGRLFTVPWAGEGPAHLPWGLPEAGGSFFPWPEATGSGVCQQLTEGKMMERRKKIALELSELVVYCRPVPFDEESKAQWGVHVRGCPPERVGARGVFCPLMWRMRSLGGRGSASVLPVFPEIGTERACYRDMSSFPETKAEKYVNKAKGKKFLQYNRLQLSRIYPKGQRLDSSNYDPLPMWICGSQLVALNFQTPGEEVPCGAGGGPPAQWGWRPL